MSNAAQEFEQLEALARTHNVRVVPGPFNSIELELPDGFQWAEELHVLVTSGDDHAPWRSVIKAAKQDLLNNAPHIQPCPENCPCKEVA